MLINQVFLDAFDGLALILGFSAFDCADTGPLVDPEPC